MLPESTLITSAELKNELVVQEPGSEPTSPGTLNIGPAEPASLQTAWSLGCSMGPIIPGPLRGQRREVPGHTSAGLGAQVTRAWRRAALLG